jgi:hypothetical protein
MIHVPPSHPSILAWRLMCTLVWLTPGSLFATPCSPLFAALVREVHRPAFEQSAGISDERALLESARASRHQYLDEVGRREPPPISQKKHQAAIKLVDSFFNEIIKGYPKETQKRIRSIYKSMGSYTYTPGLFVQTQNFANWHLRQGSNGQPKFSVEFDAGLRSTELIKKILLIHECAVHIGQADQRLAQVGPEQLMAENDTKDPYLFTEMSAALAEKTLLAALDFSTIEADAGRIPDRFLRLALLGVLYTSMKMKLHGFVELHHRGEALPPSAAQVELFMARPR